uniref:SynChlorMet cassette protein ScmC n=1 Tax=Eubacterium cellulosolvens (strain ATCC 43171 / JCM 9499 / 6) TaxID=633697 RepID=I5AUZ6_EUBC6
MCSFSAFLYNGKEKNMIIELANIKFNVLDFKPEKLIVRGKYGNYIREDVETDVDIKVTSDEIDRSRIEYESNDQEVCIETAAIRKIYETLLDFDAFVMHAASISVDGRAYAFSASSGTGKSTHMNLWKRKFEGKYQVVNGDRTIFRRNEEGRLLACGSPWCGKEMWESDVMVPVQGFCFIERGLVNKTRKLDTEEAYFKLMNSTLIPGDSKRLMKQMDLMGWVSENVPVFVAEVNMDPEAADVVYEAMK